MSLRTLVWLVSFAFACALTLRLYGLVRQDQTASLRREQSVYEQLRDTITESYVEPVNERELFFGALEGMAATLDPHSAFWPPKKREAERANTTGHLGGIGIEIRLDARKNLILPRVLPGYPAFKAGLWPGDRLLAIEGQPTAGMSLDQASQLIRGEPGTKVRLSVARVGHEQELNFEIVRAVIKIESVPEALILTPPESAAARVPAGAPHIGYVLLARFQEDTAADLDKALASLEAQGMEALVLDLRQNPGGLLEVALEVCDMFLSDGTIVQVRERAAEGPGRRQQSYQARPQHADRTCPMAVLVDGDSASASEILAGCFKDLRRAVIVGDKTHGKGSVQTIIPVTLDDWGEAALKLTTARFFTPSGSVIDGNGVQPEVAAAFTPAQVLRLVQERYRRQCERDAAQGVPWPPERTVGNGAGNAEPSGPDASQPPQPFHDLQLEKAIEALTARLRQG